MTRPRRDCLSFTDHAISRMRSRGITPGLVALAVAHGERRGDPTGEGAEVFLVTGEVAMAVPGLRDHGGLRVIVADGCLVVTAMYNQSRGRAARVHKLRGRGTSRHRASRRLGGNATHGKHRRRDAG